MTPTLTEAFMLMKAEGSAWRLVIGHGPQNSKLARFYEVRLLALSAYCNALFQQQQVNA